MIWKILLVFFIAILGIAMWTLVGELDKSSPVVPPIETPTTTTVVPYEADLLPKSNGWGNDIIIEYPDNNWMMEA